jgi:hypothetical protein
MISESEPYNIEGLTQDETTHVILILQKQAYQLMDDYRDCCKLVIEAEKSLNESKRRMNYAEIKLKSVVKMLSIYNSDAKDWLAEFQLDI